jgi:hypothetical protein
MEELSWLINWFGGILGIENQIVSKTTGRIIKSLEPLSLFPMNTYYTTTHDSQESNDILTQQTKAQFPGHQKFMSDLRKAKEILRKADKEHKMDEAPKRTAPPFV